ncbi:UDP-glucose 4-epimerase GalE [Roseibium algae]|uniref:UDP-glucose 4-epimerase n=1 Tax=Roseibium algae TaxID=3123038 RepID=A0ABU8TQ97_9HYPH
MTILITGGAGYIGSHCCVTFLEAGHDIVVLDNLGTSNVESLNRIAEIAQQKISFEQIDIRDKPAVADALKRYRCSAVVHFAGLKIVGESISDPLSYYDNNVVGTHRLLAAMQETGVRKLIFSSSANVYGPPETQPVTEAHPTGPISPYGKTKAIIEQMLTDLAVSDESWRIAILRYFNPVGAHKSGLIGEDPQDVPTNLMPYIAQVAAGRRDCLSVFGDDYDTPDGTGVRDYIHVVDLVEGHLKAYETLAQRDSADNCLTVNLGTGTGYSVLDMIKAFQRASNKPIPYTIAPRRDGDVASCYADTSQASKVIGWTAKRDLEAMCHDTWNWVCKNPNGYED